MRDAKINPNKRLLLADLDDTLIDTTGFKNLLFDTLSRNCGLDHNTVRNTYEFARMSGGVEGWTRRLVGALSKKSGAEDVVLTKFLYNCINQITIHANVYKFIAEFRGKKFLFTHGDKKFQKAKLSKLKLNELFDKIIITNRDKFDFLKFRISGRALHIDNELFHKVVIIDDQKNLLIRLKKYSWIKAIHADKLIKQQI